MKTLILAGGLGTRLQEETTIRPKPMVEIGGRPILWHIMKGYASRGFCEFVLALGYKGEVIKEYFLNYYHLSGSLGIRLVSGEIACYNAPAEDWQVDLIDTEIHTQTGGRIKRCAPWLKDATFMMTYGDGVSNVDIAELVRFHKNHGKLATVTAVRPPARFGTFQLDGDKVISFAEKPQAGEGWINGGFFVLEPKVLDYIEGDETVFEREPLERLAADGELMVWRHHDFWHCMDTLRDLRMLEGIWHSGQAQWKTW